MVKLTVRQRSVITRELFDEDTKEPWVMLCDAGDDRVAQNLSNKGLGYFVNNSWQYSWRRRSGYTNNFTLNDAGLKLREELMT